MPSAYWDSRLELDKFEYAQRLKKTGILAMNGEIKVTIFISGKNLEKNPHRNLVIVFTSAKGKNKNFFPIKKLFKKKIVKIY